MIVSKLYLNFDFPLDIKNFVTATIPCRALTFDLFLTVRAGTTDLNSVISYGTTINFFLDQQQISFSKYSLTFFALLLSVLDLPKILVLLKDYLKKNDLKTQMKEGNPLKIGLRIV